jgi:hypothetical protein
MRTSSRRRIRAFAVSVASAFALLATTAAVALATVPGGLVEGQGQNLGRGGVFTVTTASGWSSLEVLGGVAISLAAMVLIAWFGISSDKRARTKLAVAPSGASAAGVAARKADQERKAA